VTTTFQAGVPGDAMTIMRMPEDANVPPPPGPGDDRSAVTFDFHRAVAAFSRHDAAKARHLKLLDRLRAANRDNKDLRDSMARLLEHSTSARVEMAAVGEGVAAFTRELRDRGVAPEKAILAVKLALHDAVNCLSEFERPEDRRRLMDDVTAVAIQAYYG
jgi:hypothetical protein